jgi:hypothetical protein
MIRFTAEPMGEMIETLSRTLGATSLSSPTPVTFELPILPPENDGFPGEIAAGQGEPGEPVRYRTLQNVVDLADALGCRLFPAGQNGCWMRFTIFQRPPRDNWHSTGRNTEKYGATSPFQRIEKLEDPSFCTDLHRCLNEVQIHRCESLISLGVNAGDELLPVYRLNPQIHCTGIDHAASALQMARQRFGNFANEFIEMDINHISTISERHFHRYGVFMSLGTLHSPGVDSKRVFMWCMQHLLASQGSVIVGFPNCRWVQGHAVYGARTRNRRETDLSLVIKDIYFIKKYLQQHRFNVTVFGKYYLFVVGTPNSPGP